MFDPLRDAYFYHRRKGSVAARAIVLARADVAAGKRRYISSRWPDSYPAASPSSERPGFWNLETNESAGFRRLGAVESDFRFGTWKQRTEGETGWYTDPYGDHGRDGFGLCFGVVYLLPARDGKTRLVAGYQFGGVDGGPTLDLSNVYEYESPGRGYLEESDAALSAARHADSLAQHEAEEERDYQRAWQSGSLWAVAGEELQEARREALELFRERREARTLGERFPAVCKAATDGLRAILAHYAELRARRASLADGDGMGRGSEGELAFYPDKRLRAAFNDGAGSEVLT